MTPNRPDTAGRGAAADPATLPLLPTRELVVFPRMVAPLFVGRDKSISAIERAFGDKTPLILSSQREPGEDDPDADDISPVGTRATVLQLFKLPDGSVKAIVEGIERVRIEHFESTAPHFVVSYSAIEPADRDAARCRALARRVTAEFVDYAQMSPHVPDEIQFVVAQAADAEEVADIVAAHLMVSTPEKQALLETESTEQRLTVLLELLAQENAVLGLEQEIAAKVQQRIETGQRQILLQEKLKVLRDEIEAEGGDEADGYARMLAGRRLPAAAARVVAREIEKLRQAPAMSPEVAVIRALLDTVFDLPWGRTTEAAVDVVAVARHLDQTHYGLKDVKDRVLEYLAVCSLLKGDRPGTILCLAGPPGTGKSSVARAVAEALGRPFARIALGGVRDEAEIRGHRRTYVGAMPGRVIEALTKTGVDDPVLLLDELDKLGSDWRGDPAAALMEVLDPEQNHAFRDNYLEVEYDLSKVLFIATANDTDQIPDTLYDRLEVIRLSGYTLDEKLAIARRHLVPRVARESGLRRGDVRFGRGALPAVVRGYTREAGVRELERSLRRIFRKVARRHVEDGLALPVTVTPDDLRSYLGEAVWLETELRRTGRVGESLALAWTGDGGEVLSVEATLVRGRGELVLTGQLGEVMQESASAAWGYLLASAERDERLRALLRPAPWYGRKGLDVTQYDVRVHVPEGAVPKDGPSAGLAIAAAMLSALTGRPLRPRVALSGEITLSGRILRVGGLKEKLLAATRSGVRTVVLPEANRASVAEVPAEIVDRLDIHYVREFAEAVPLVVARRAGVRGRGEAPREDDRA
ncbi:MAG TPA: endopeptidase La [Thermoleophilia bacterium]|nr:endopeptidase La [Thermoleophilia bacterium]